MKDWSDGELHDHVRWCAGCNANHGPLYDCENYPPAVRAEIAEADARMRAALSDPVWCAKRIENGLPPIGIEIFKFFAGISSDEEEQ